MIWFALVIATVVIVTVPRYNKEKNKQYGSPGFTLAEGGFFMLMGLFAALLPNALFMGVGPQTVTLADPINLSSITIDGEAKYVNTTTFDAGSDEYDNYYWFEGTELRQRETDDVTLKATTGTPRIVYRSQDPTWKWLTFAGEDDVVIYLPQDDLAPLVNNG